MSTPIFEQEIKVRDYECDAQGIVNNANYQHYYEVIRHEFFEEHDLHFSKLHDEGIDLVVTSVFIQYKNSLRGGQKFICTIDSIEREGVRYYFNQNIIRSQDNKLCSTCRAEVVCVKKGFVGRPDVLDNAFGKYFEI